MSERKSPGSLIGEVKAEDNETGRNGQFDITVVPGTFSITRQHHYNDVSSTTVTTSHQNSAVVSYMPFVILANGSVYLNQSLDHEKVTSYEFDVIVVDRGVPPLR